MCPRQIINHNQPCFFRLELLIVLLSMLLSSCNGVSTILKPTPLPGWRIPVSQLFVDSSVFPDDVTLSYSEPDGKESDSTINHFFREWSGNSSGRIWQNVFRSYKVSEAEEYYDQLRNSMFSVNGTPSPDNYFSEFLPPDEVEFTSQFVDEYYFACGYWDGYNCEMLARYRNYVITLHLPHEVPGSDDPGLSFSQMKPILENMDQRFVLLFASFE